MKKALLLLAALAMLWAFQARQNVASAHGGAYRGPAGEVPPGQRDPKDPQPPPENPTTPTPGPGETTGTPTPGGPTTGGDNNPPPDGTPRPGPAAPAGPAAPTGPGGPTTGGRRNSGPAPMSFENWLFWWSYNKDRILNLKATVKQNEKKVATGSSVFVFGGATGGKDAQAPTDRAIKDQIIPALEKVVANKNIHPDIRGGALIALARADGIGTSNKAHLADFFAVAKANSGEDQVVQESALVALGVLQNKDPEVRKFLVDIVDDMDYPMRGRCFAMISLGLLKDNDPDVFAALERRLDGREAHQDIPVAALLTIGLIGDNTKVPTLTDWLESGRFGRQKFGDLEKAWIVAALGKIGDPQSLPAIEKTLRGKDRLTKRSAAIAFGQMLTQVEPKTRLKYVQGLIKFHDSESDLTTKNFTAISLGRIAGDASADADIRDGIVKYLKKAYKSAQSSTERPFIALSLGLIGFDGMGGEKPADLKHELADPILETLRELKGDKVALGAQAIALGMIGDKRKDTVDLLVSILKDRGTEKKLRGSAAVALGLIGDTAAKEAIKSALQEREDRDLRVDTAVAAGLIGDSEAVGTLVNVLNDKKASQFVLGSVALALGQIGDASAVGPLITILEPDKANNASYPDLTRALVAVALGQLADRNDIRVLARLSEDINYRASVPSLDEILSIL